MAIKKFHRNDCEQSREGSTTKRRKKDYEQEAQVKEAAGTSSKKLTGLSNMHETFEKDSNDGATQEKTRLERKRRRTTQTLQC